MSKSNGLGPGTIEIDGEKLATNTFELDGEKFTVRELLQDENDDIWDASLGADGKVNTRLNTRMALSKGLVTPAKSADEIGKFGTRKYGLILREFNRLNTIPAANPTPPAGSAGPTSPSGGAPTPESSDDLAVANI